MSMLELLLVFTLGLMGLEQTCGHRGIGPRPRDKDCCHSLQRHSRCDAAGARTTFDGPKTLSPSLLPWLADTASAVRSFLPLFVSFLRRGERSFHLVTRPSRFSAPSLNQSRMGDLFKSEFQNSRSFFCFFSSSRRRVAFSGHRWAHCIAG